MLGGELAGQRIGRHSHHDARAQRLRQIWNAELVEQERDGARRFIAQHDRILFCHLGLSLFAFVGGLNPDDTALARLKGQCKGRLSVDCFRSSVDGI
jgi:hypothetical protein